MRVAITLPGEILPLPALLCNYGEVLTTAKVESVSVLNHRRGFASEDASEGPEMLGLSPTPLLRHHLLCRPHAASSQNADH